MIIQSRCKSQWFGFVVSRFPRPFTHDALFFPYFNVDGKFLQNYTKKIVRILSVDIPHFDLRKKPIKRVKKMNHSFCDNI